jgi:Mce-associated membrane protein
MTDLKRAASLGLLVAAAGFFGWSGWTYWQSTHDDSLTFAKARDQVVRAGRQEIADLNTVDNRNIDAGLNRWLNASTGPLHDQFQRTTLENKLSIQQGGTRATGTVTDFAVTELDTRAGDAKVIATVQVETIAASGSTSTDRKRFEAVLTRTGNAWKLGSLTAIPVNGS